VTLIALGLSWLAGIALAQWLQPPLPALGLLALPALAVALLWRRERGPRLAAACALALLAGGARLLWAIPHFGPGDLAAYNDRGRVTLVGVVDDEPDVRDTYQNLRLRMATRPRPIPKQDGYSIPKQDGYSIPKPDGYSMRWGFCPGRTS